MTDIEKGALIRTHLLSAEGRAKLLASLVQPSQAQLSHLSFAPMLFSDGWPPGEETSFSPNLSFVSSIPPLVLPRRREYEDGQVQTEDWVQTEPWIFARSHQLLLHQVALELNEAVLHFLDGRAKTHEPAVAPIGQAVLDPILQKRFLMNARDYADLRKFGRDILDIELNREMLKAGLMGVYKGTASLLVSRAVPVNQVYSTSVLGAFRCIVDPVSLIMDENEVVLSLKFRFYFKLAADPVVHRLDVVRRRGASLLGS